MLLKYLQAKLKVIQYSPLHPQWISNRCHLEKFKELVVLNNKVILDIGSGNSPAIKYIDKSNFLIRSDYPSTSASYGNKPDLYLDATKIPLADQSIDCVLIFEVLEHISDFEKVVDEMARVVKKNGVIYLSVPFIYPEHDLPGDYQRFTKNGIDNILKKRGITVECNKPLGAGVDAIFLMINMYLLVSVASASKKCTVLSVLLIPLVSAVCLSINVMSIIFRVFPKASEFYLGRFVRARRC